MDTSAFRCIHMRFTFSFSFCFDYFLFNGVSYFDGTIDVYIHTYIYRRLYNNIP
jgi:hypothetical protein